MHSITITIYSYWMILIFWHKLIKIIDIAQGKSMNNWFMNSVLQVYLRLPRVSSLFMEVLNLEKINLESATDCLLIDLIAKAYWNCNKRLESVPVVNMNAFRSQLGSECNMNFHQNQLWDAHSFLNYCHSFL